MSDHIVRSQDILRAVLQVRRQGVADVLTALESVEPSLAEYLAEEASAIDHAMSELGGSANQLQQLHVRVRSFALVTLLTLRQAESRLWQQEDPTASIDDQMQTRPRDT